MEPDAVYSYTQISKYLACERQYAYAYSWGWRPHTVSRAMSLGSTVHHLLDKWWLGADVNDISKIEVTDFVIALEQHSTVEDCISIAEHALWLIYRYDKMYAKDRETCRVIEVESERQLLLPKFGERTYALTTKIDKLIHSPAHGGLVFIDHKTVGQFPKEDWIDLDLQFSIYFMVLRQHDIDVVCAILDTLYTYRWKKKGEILGWDETNVEDSFRRVLVDRTPAMLEVVAKELYRACDRIWHLRQGNHEPLRNITAACLWCDFRAPCYEALQGDDASEQALLGEYFDAKRRPPLRTNLSPMEVEI